MIERKQNIFAQRAGQVLSDLPVVLFCRSGASRLRLRAKQISSQQVARMSAAICGSRGNDEGPECRDAHPGYTLMSASQLKRPNYCAAAK